MDNHKSRADGFSTFSAFRSTWTRLFQRVVYAFSPERDEDIRKEGFLHFAYWATLQKDALSRAGVPKDEIPKHGALLFVSVFNGSASDYVKGFSDHLGDEMNALWGGCEQWNDAASNLDDLTHFINRHRRRVNLFFNAYRDGAKGIRKALELRSELEQLADAQYGGSPPSVKDELEKLARSLEGSA